MKNWLKENWPIIIVLSIYAGLFSLWILTLISDYWASWAGEMASWTLTFIYWPIFLIIVGFIIYGVVGNFIKDKTWQQVIKKFLKIAGFFAATILLVNLLPDSIGVWVIYGWIIYGVYRLWLNDQKTIS